MTHPDRIIPRAESYTGGEVLSMKAKRNHAVAGRVENVLDLPVGVLTEAPRIELAGNRRALVEGCERILECDEDRVCLRTAVGTVRFTGRELCLHCRTADSTVVTGRLLSIEFL